MFEPEYRASFRILKSEIGLFLTMKISLSAVLSVRKMIFEINEEDKLDQKKNILKNHFALLAVLYEKLIEKFGDERTQKIMHRLLVECGPIFMRGFTQLDQNEDLRDFISIYKKFECQNLLFEILEESPSRFEIKVTRCLIYEAFKELGLAEITKWMCDIAFDYFGNYHPNMKYSKDKMLARGDNYCHEVFIWND